MASVNKIIVIGNVGNEPEMRFTPNGNPVTSFRVATGWRYTTQGERKEETEWFTVVAWNKLAEQCNQFLTKGRLVYVEGRLRSRTWEGKDGKTHFTNEIVAEKVTFLDRQAAAAQPEEGGEETGGELSPDDIPFS
jgi:single-strand DNA-binding protein